MSDLIKKISDILKNANICNHLQEARWIAEESDSAEKALNTAKRRADGEPLQYLLGTAPFRDLMLKVDNRVLIPRPETETLVQWILDHAPIGGKVLDLGCGSGAIAIASAAERSDLHITAVDISRDALELATENAHYCGVSNVSFIQSDLFSNLQKQKFDIIGANLPYVTEEEYKYLPREVKDFEPKLALTAPREGLMLIIQAIRELPKHLNSKGAAIFELSPEQADTAVKELENIGFSAGIVKDLCGRNRFVTGICL